MSISCENIEFDDIKWIIFLENEMTYNYIIIIIAFPIKRLKPYCFLKKQISLIIFQFIIPS